MRIVDMEATVLAIPFSESVEGSGFKGQNWELSHVVLVRVDTDAGVTGWGEAFGYGMHASVKATIENIIKPRVMGVACDDVKELITAVRRENSIYGQNGVLQYAISGLDIALWDIKARARGEPLHSILGDAGKTKLAAYSSLFRYGDPGHVSQRCAAVVADGFKSIKLHEVDLDVIKAARESVGDSVAITVDTNCPWSADEAIAIAKGLAPLGVEWLEEPVFPANDYFALARVQEEGGIPVACGENACMALEFEQVIENTPLQVLQPSISKVGGISEFMDAASTILDAGRRLMPHTAYHGPAFVANLHCLAALGCDSLVEWFDLNLEAQPMGDSIVPQDGTCSVPDGPGLGLVPDPDVIKGYRVEA